jgi:hypothetical protein
VILLPLTLGFGAIPGLMAWGCVAGWEFAWSLCFDRLAWRQYDHAGKHDAGGVTDISRGLSAATPNTHQVKGASSRNDKGKLGWFVEGSDKLQNHRTRSFPMCVVTQVSRALQTVLSTEAQQAAIRCGVIQRHRKLDGPSLIQGLVLGWMEHPNASLEQLAQMTAACGAAITPQALDERFTPQLAECCKQLLEGTVAHTIRTQPAAVELLNRFAGVYLLDCTMVALPDCLHRLWPGCGGDGHQAALKLQVRLDLCGGQLQGPAVLAGRTADQRGPLVDQPAPVGSLRLADLGYFSLDQLERWNQAGAWWLMRLPCGNAVFDVQGQRLDLLRLLRRQSEPLDRPVLLGKQCQLPCRLLVWPVASSQLRKRRRVARQKARKHGYCASAEKLAWCRYEVAITNLSPTQLNLSEAQVLLRARWQIEMLFKLWKSYGKLNESRSQKPWRRLTEIYAKLIGLVIEHWLLLAVHWDRPHRSWFRAMLLFQDHALLIAYELSSQRGLERLCRRLRHCLTACGRTNIRNKSPSTYQQLTQPQLASTLT